MCPMLATPPTPVSDPDATPATCPHCDGGVVDVQGLLACHDCDWTRGGR